jgi:hypothetical protein
MQSIPIKNMIIRDTLQSFLISVFAPALLSFILSLAAKSVGMVTELWFIPSLFFIALNSISLAVLRRQKDAGAFTRALIGAVVIRILLSLVLIIVMSFLDSVHTLSFFMHFTVAFVIFTIFEIRYYRATQLRH